MKLFFLLLAIGTLSAIGEDRVPAMNDRVRESQRRAVAKYPELALEHSRIHDAFMDQLAKAKVAAGSRVIYSDDWPMVIADWAARALKAEQEEAATAEAKRVKERGDAAEAAAAGAQRAKSLVNGPEKVAAPGWTILHAGSPLSASLQMLEKAAQYVMDKDQGALEKLIEDNLVFTLKIDLEVKVVESPLIRGHSNFIKVRPKGETVELWTLSGAIK